MEAPIPLFLDRQRGFASTHWTTVRACAGNDTVSACARQELCRDYWYPLYAYIKRSGYQGCDAEDLTQEFFAYILNRPWFAQADQSKGLFRSFLLATFQNFLKGRLDHNKARRRAGAYQHVYFDLADAEGRFTQSSAATVAPGEAFEIEWASAIIETSLRRLEEEYAASGKANQYLHLKVFMTVAGMETNYDDVARVLQLSSDNVKVCVHRLRKRYGAILQEEVGRTVACPEDVPEEMSHMRRTLANIAV